MYFWWPASYSSQCTAPRCFERSLASLSCCDALDWFGFLETKEAN